MPTNKQRTGPFTIIIPARNEGDLLRMTVESIVSQTDYPDYEVLIVDDGSTDGSCEPFLSWNSSVRVIRSGGIGVARARNLGAHHAHGEYIVFIDAHCLVSANWLTGLARALAPADVGLAGPCFTRLREPFPRGCGMVWTDYTLDLCWYEPLNTRKQYEVPLTPGGCQAFRRSTFDSLGGYEQGFTRWGSEDVEICLRAWLLGYRVVVKPSVVVAHYFRESRNYEVDDKEVTYNVLRMIHLHFSPHRIRRVLRAVSANPFVGEALDDLYRSDVFEQRAKLEAARVHDDGWFFRYINRAIEAG